MSQSWSRKRQMLLEGEAERAGVDLLMLGRDGSQGKHGEIHSREEETGGDSGRQLWGPRCLERVTIQGGREVLSGGGTRS